MTPARPPSAPPDAATAIQWLREKRHDKDLAGLARYGIFTTRAIGVSMGNVQAVAKRAGQSHRLAAQLWASGWYEARMLAVFVEEPDQVTAAQLDRWCRDFDNWAICDTACFKLFDRTPFAWSKVPAWARRREEYVRRAAFALLASLAAHDMAAGDKQFLATFPLIEKAAIDERNFVKKGVSWALRAIGHRNAALHARAVALAEKLADAEDKTARWIGKDTLRDLQRPAVVKRVKARR